MKFRKIDVIKCLIVAAEMADGNGLCGMTHEMAKSLGVRDSELLSALRSELEFEEGRRRS